MQRRRRGGPSRLFRRAAASAAAERRQRRGRAEIVKAQPPRSCALPPPCLPALPFLLLSLPQSCFRSRLLLPLKTRGGSPAHDCVAARLEVGEWVGVRARAQCVALRCAGVTRVCARGRTARIRVHSLGLRRNSRRLSAASSVFSDATSAAAPAPPPPPLPEPTAAERELDAGRVSNVLPLLTPMRALSSHVVADYRHDLILLMVVAAAALFGLWAAFFGYVPDFRPPGTCTGSVSDLAIFR